MPKTKPNCWPKLGHKTVQNQVVQKLLDINLPDQFLKNGYNLIQKNSNVMKPVEKCPQDTDLQNWYFDQNSEIKRTRSNSWKNSLHQNLESDQTSFDPRTIFQSYLPLGKSIWDEPYLFKNLRNRGTTLFCESSSNYEFKNLKN